MELILAVIVGAVAGAFAAYFSARLRAQAALHSAEQENARLAGLQALNDSQLSELRSQRERLEEELRATRSRLGEQNTALAQAETRLAEQASAAERQMAELKDLHARFQDSFKALSSDALRNNNTQFLELARETLAKYQEGAQGDLSKRQEAINALVLPLREALQNVDKKVGELEKAREGAYAGLREQIKGLAQSQLQLQGETASLVQALRKPDVRGQWGEVQLEKTVRFAGMVEHVDFVQQESLSTEAGRLRPDLIVRLPNGNQIVIDAKTPLDAYLQAVAANDSTERKTQLARHARQIRDQIRKLGSKQYWKQFEPSPEFVVLFLPGEAFFSAALEQDPELIEFGTTENVILATPTTLIALLKAVAYGWRQEQIAQQAQQISDLGRDLYERLCTAGGHLERVGSSLGKSVESYNKAIRSFDTRVLVSARKFLDLAPISSKELPAVVPIEQTPQPSSALEWACDEEEKDTAGGSTPPIP